MTIVNIVEKEMGKLRENSLSRKILLEIGRKVEKILDLGITVLVDPHSLFKGFSLYRDPSVGPPLIKKGINRLKKWGYLEEDGKKIYLTFKGRTEIIKNIFKNKKNKMKWDRKWRIITFDIPEMSRKDRNFLRRELKWIGFKELQKSVWVYPYEIEKELQVLLKLWKIEFQGDIRFLTVEKISDDLDLKKYFKI